MIQRSLLVLTLAPALASAGLPAGRAPQVGRTQAAPRASLVSAGAAARALARPGAVLPRPAVGLTRVSPMPDQRKTLARPGLLGSSQAAFKTPALAGVRAAEFFDRSAARQPMPDVPTAWSLDMPDQYNQFWDAPTGSYQTQASKIGIALKAIQDKSPLGSAILNGVKGKLGNPGYRIDGAWGRGISYGVRAQGDNPEKWNETEPLVVLTADAVRQLSPAYLAAKMAGAYMKLLWKDKVPNSAEKTYAEGSVAARVFAQITGSNINNWLYNLDYEKYERGYKGFDLYRHYYQWYQGLGNPERRYGPYFQRIMNDSGDPETFTDAAGRRTLSQRYQRGEITAQQAADGQAAFDGFTQNERP